MGFFAKHVVWRIRISFCPRNHVLHRNRCGWLRSEQNSNRGYNTTVHAVSHNGPDKAYSWIWK